MAFWINNDDCDDDDDEEAKTETNSKENSLRSIEIEELNEKAKVRMNVVPSKSNNKNIGRADSTDYDHNQIWSQKI